MAKKKPYISKNRRIEPGFVHTDVVGDSLPTNKQEYVIDHAGIRPNGYLVEMPKIQSNDDTALQLVVLIFDCIDALDNIAGPHPEYKTIKEALNEARMALNQVALDVAGNIAREDYKSGVQPSDLNNILISKVNDGTGDK